MQVVLLVWCAACISTVCCLEYPITLRNQSQICLPDIAKQNANRMIRYSDGTLHPVLVPYQGWPSAHIIGNIAYILLKEVMGYSTVLVDTGTLMSEHTVNYAAGCLDPDDSNCTDFNILRPQVHFTLEVWEGGRQRAAMLHEDVRPDLLSMLSYNLIDQWYIWLDQVEAGLRDSPPIALDYYRSYNADHFDPRGDFDPWEKLLSLLPPGIVVRCSLAFFLLS
jgi:hypothetical protein